ncbi:exported hypothetical protein [Nitrolancea hollandica Lb]|uniref:Uncharacterized protein n=1 Tax=Nitrolancea hollandica Lb TaxID=1129897 RepID=I4EI79_9BACT|nr:exported hypothetical protein [Nitrolancea hollandica Lb]
MPSIASNSRPTSASRRRDSPSVRSAATDFAIAIFLFSLLAGVFLLLADLPPSHNRRLRLRSA